MQNADGSRGQGQRCATCRQPIIPGHNAVACSVCGVPQHGGCWQQHGGCATRGCTGRPLVYLPGAQPADAPVSLRLELKHEESTPPAHTPIWAPNPGVPIVARILAYTFGLLMLLVTYQTFARERPPDSAPIPGKWSSFESAQGMTIPYPEGWFVAEDTRENVVRLMLMPGSPVRVDILSAESRNESVQLTPEMIRPGFEEKLQQIKGYEPQTGVTTDDTALEMHAFRFVTRGPRGSLAMSGAWTMRARDQQVLILVATAPREGWQTTERIFSHIADNLQ
ncbi:MAG: RING finger protein [Armatimonadota bacterium]